MLDGIHNGETYTDSKEALDYNFQRGYKYFEIDLVETWDGHLVGFLDWER
jgi:hypothetical protein